MKRSFIRYDLDRSYQYNEYKKAIAYANEYIHVNGMREQKEKLNNTLKIYNQDIENIIKPERELENNKYLQWEIWNKAKKICMDIMIYFIIGTIIFWILGIVKESVFSLLGLLGFIISVMILFATLISKVMESLYASIYRKYINIIIDKINERNVKFEHDAHQYYRVMDNLYLQSLDPMHREMVLMHREQMEYQKEMKSLEMERNRKEEERLRREKEQLEETRKTRRAQERLLAIEEERERRNGYR